jgi:hypothetical protein
MTADPTGWPDADEGRGHHWAKMGEMWMLLVGVNGAWQDTLGFNMPKRIIEQMAYYGPILTPAEVAAALAQARRNALEEAARIAERAAANQPWITVEGGCERIAADIRAKAQEAGDE